MCVSGRVYRTGKNLIRLQCHCATLGSNRNRLDLRQGPHIQAGQVGQGERAVVAVGVMFERILQPQRVLAAQTGHRQQATYPVDRTFRVRRVRCPDRDRVHLGALARHHRVAVG